LLLKQVECNVFEAVRSLAPALNLIVCIRNSYTHKLLVFSDLLVVDDNDELFGLLVILYWAVKRSSILSTAQEAVLVGRDAETVLHNL